MNIEVWAQVANLTVNHPKAEKYFGLPNFQSKFGQVGVKLEPKLVTKLARSWASVKPPHDGDEYRRKNPEGTREPEIDFCISLASVDYQTPSSADWYSPWEPLGGYEDGLSAIIYLGNEGV